MIGAGAAGAAALDAVAGAGAALGAADAAGLGGGGITSVCAVVPCVLAQAARSADIPPASRRRAPRIFFEPMAAYNVMKAPRVRRFRSKLCIRSRSPDGLQTGPSRWNHFPHRDSKIPMALKTILEFPDPRLRTRAQPVTRFDAGLHRLIDDMFETMYAAPGIGLAATQVDVHQRIIVIDVSEAHNDPVVLINPEIMAREGEASAEEGCLSVPGIFDEVKRAGRVRVRAQDRTGAVFERDCEELLAVCVQHEMDHLEGKLFVDYLSSLKRDRIRKRLEKERKARAQRRAEAVPQAL